MILNEKFFNERFVKGIHWPEPPSYKDHTDLLLGKYNPDIEHSYWKLWQEWRYWIKKDKLYLNEVESNDKLPEPDPFKVTHVPIKWKSEVVSEFPQ